MSRIQAVLDGLTRAGHLAARPATLLVVQLVLVFVFLAQNGRLEPAWVPDSRSYVIGSQADSLEDTLSHYRSFALPLLLRMVGGDGVPTTQVAIYFGSVLLFGYALRVYASSPWLALAAATPLAYHPVLALASMIQPDFLSAAMAVIAVSCLMLLAGPARAGRPLLWAGLTLSVFAAYHLRPAAVFLVPLIPAAGWLLRLCRKPAHPRVSWRWVAALACVTALPYLGFATTRWLTVGHFGLVPFGGTNLAGLTANFLDAEVVRALPEEQKSLARKMLRSRQRRQWRPLTLDGDVQEAFRQYSDNIWRISVQAAEREIKAANKRALRSGKAPIERRYHRIVRNEMLGELSSSIIRLRPWLYFKWVRGALEYGLDQLLDFGWIRWPLLLILCTLPVALLHRPIAGPEPSPHLVLLGLLALGLGYFLVYLLLVSLVSFPFARYFVSTLLFLPSALCAELFALWRAILARR